MRGWHGPIVASPLGVFAVTRALGERRAGLLLGLDAETGAERWRRELSTHDRTLLIVGDGLLLHEPHGLHLLDTATGRARGFLEGPGIEQVVVLDEHAYLWTHAAGLRRAAIGDDGLALDATWVHDDRRLGPLASARGRLVVQVPGPRTHAAIKLLDPATGALDSEVPGEFVAGDPRTLVVGRASAIVAESGGRRPDWRLLNQRVLALGRAHVVTQSRRGVAEVHRRAKGERLKLPMQLAPAAAIARDIAYISGDARLHAIDADGQVLWSLRAADLGGPISAGFGLRAWHRRVLVHLTTGRLVCLG